MTNASAVSRLDSAAHNPAAQSRSTEPVDLLATAILSCGGVSSLSGGMFGEVATYLPGRRVAGIRLSPGLAEIHVVSVWGVPVPDVADQIRSACAAIAPGTTVDVYVDDVAIPTPASIGSSDSGAG